MKIFNIFIYISIILFILHGCKEDDPEVITIDPVTLNNFPIDDTSLLLLTNETIAINMEWNGVKASDETLVFYFVQFDKEDGDFSNPVGTINTDSVGLAKSVGISHQFLNIFAENAGIAPLTQGKLKWRVVATNGIASSYSDVHTIEVERPEGIAEIPASLYLTGDATEAGTDVTQAIVLTKLSPGVFEIYTSLTEGTYRFVDNVTTWPVVSFCIDGATIRKGATANSPDPAKRLYYIYLNFNTAEATVSEILSLGLWHGESSDVIGELTYQDNGVWGISGITPFTEGKDDRYKFRMTLKAADGSLSDIFWGSSQVTNNRPTSTTAESYYYLIPQIDFSQYGYSYKFSTASENKAVDINFILTSSATYTHEVEISQ